MKYKLHELLDEMTEWEYDSKYISKYVDKIIELIKNQNSASSPSSKLNAKEEQP